MKSIPYGKQHITEEDIFSVATVLRSDFLTQGPAIAEFEKNFSRYVGSDFAVAVSSGTAALHLSVLALGFPSGKKVITTPITFAASANCVLYCGGEVAFCDIDPTTYLLDLDKLSDLLSASPLGTYSGIIAVDFAGNPVNLEKLKRIATEYGLWIIEDACHAPGGYFVSALGSQERCGNSKYADTAIFSFHPVKHIAAGEGGMITTNDKKLYDRLIELRSHGITRDIDRFENSIDLASGKDGTSYYPAWYMEMQNLGFNYRLTDFQAALADSQLSRADTGLQRRHDIARVYHRELSGMKGIQLQQVGNDTSFNGHAYHLFIIEVSERLELYEELRQKGVYSQVHYIPVHLMPYYRRLGWKQGDFPIAEHYYSRCLSLPIYASLSEVEQEFVIKAIKVFYDGINSAKGSVYQI